MHPAPRSAPAAARAEPSADAKYLADALMEATGQRPHPRLYPYFLGINRLGTAQLAANASIADQAPVGGDAAFLAVGLIGQGAGDFLLNLKWSHLSGGAFGQLALHSRALFGSDWRPFAFPRPQLIPHDAYVTIELTNLLAVANPDQRVPVRLQGREVMTLDPAEFALRCLNAPAAVPSRIALPCAGDGLGAQRARIAPEAPRQAPDAGADRFSDLLSRAHYRMFPPHLYPPLKAEPQVLRATQAAAIAAGTTRVQALAWVCPQGRAFTIQEAHVRAATGFVAAEVGFKVTRNDQVIFDGSEHTNLSPDGTSTLHPVLLPVSASEPVAFVSLPWNTTILAGERLVVELIAKNAAALTLTAHVQLRGYTYPLELIP